MFFLKFNTNFSLLCLNKEDKVFDEIFKLVHKKKIIKQQLLTP